MHGVARSRPCAIGSIKGNLGHTEGAAGIAGLIKVALALRHRVVPPSRYAEDVNPRLKLADHGLELLRDPLELPATRVVHAAVSSFGLGGTNAHLLLSTGPAEAPVPDRSGGGLLTLSAPDADGLRRNAARMAEFLDSAEAGLFSQHCWTSNQVKASGRYRLAVPAADRDLAVAALRGFTEARPGGRVATGWLFTGQGAQYPGMSLALHQTSGAYRRALSEVDEIMRPHLGGSVRELILGDERINRTEFAQPALFAVEYALARVLVELGIEPAWLLGHSIGEYAVAVLAGVFTVDDACRLVTTRGRLMQALPSGGGMLAVSAEVPADLLGDEPQVDVAAVNGPQAVVLSGPVDALDRIARRLRGVPTRRLAVSHAFHSPLVEPMLAEFAEIAQDIDYRQPEVPIYSTVRGGLLAEPMDAAYWTEQIRATVRFADAVRNALEAQATHLVEIGPQRTLATLVARLRADLPCLVPCPGPKARGLELAEVVATLHQDGLDPAWDVLYEREHRVRRRLPGHEFSTTNRFWFHDNTASDNAASDNTEPANEVSLNDVIALFQQQNAILAKFTGGTPPPPSTPTPAEPEDSAEQVLEQVARISGLPAANLQGGQRLAELGLDSIMIAELLVALRRSGRTVGQVTGTTTLDELAAGEPRPAPGRARPEICPAVYRIEEFPEVKATAKRLAEASRAGVSNPYFLVNDGIAGHTSIINGREVLNFSSYNYLGLSGHPTVVREVQDAVARYGSSCSASRIISGEKPIHRQLETELAALLGTEDAIALVSGHATNVTVIGHLLGPDDLVLHDSLAHNSILQGCQLSGATRRPFPHNDHAALDALLDEVRHRYRRVLIVLEGVYSQDGDIPDLPAFVEVKRRHRALLMVDEAHSIGVLGATGGGIGEHFGVRREDVELWCGTMSKALAGCGGYVAGSQQLVRYFKYTAPGFVYSVGMTPPNAAASLRRSASYAPNPSASPAFASAARCSCGWPGTPG